MKNLNNKKVIIDNFLTTDPYNKAGQIGIVKSVEIFDEENANVTIEFEDGIIGVYSFDTFSEVA